GPRRVLGCFIGTFLGKPTHTEYFLLPLWAGKCRKVRLFSGEGPRTGWCSRESACVLVLPQIVPHDMHLPGRYSYRGLCAMGKKILIVEDDPNVLQAMHVRLRAHHYDTSSASDAISCMAEARKSEPDLIILDLGLPGGDGFLLMDRFKKVPSLASVPVIVVSGRDIRENQKKMVKSGAKAFLQKPVDNTMLLAVIRKALGEQTLKDEPVVYNLGNPY